MGNIVTHTAHAVVCMIIKASAFGQFPPHETARTTAMAGRKEISRIIDASRRNVRIGFEAALAIAPNIKTANATRTAVSIAGRAQPKGVNSGWGFNAVTA